MEYNDYNNQGQSSVTGCNGMLYTIQRGDTLYKLSRQYNVALSTIMNANPNINVYNLQVGQRVCIPIRNGGYDNSQDSNMNQGEQRNYYSNKKGDVYADYQCPACPACPEQRECPAQRECPPQRECPAQRECPPQRECPECPDCPACPTCPVCEDCPTCPTCPVCEDCPACPTCPEQQPCPACPSCPEQEPCPSCPECEVCPEQQPCPTCPEQRPCPSCPEQQPCPECEKCPECKQKQTIIYMKPSCPKETVRVKVPVQKTKAVYESPCKKAKIVSERSCKKEKAEYDCSYKKEKVAYESPCQKAKASYDCPSKSKKCCDSDNRKQGYDYEYGCPYKMRDRYMVDADDMDGRMYNYCGRRMARNYVMDDDDYMYNACPYAKKERYCRRCGYDMYSDMSDMPCENYNKEYKKSYNKGCTCDNVYDDDYMEYCKEMYDGYVKRPAKKLQYGCSTCSNDNEEN